MCYNMFNPTFLYNNDMYETIPTLENKDMQIENEIKN